MKRDAHAELLRLVDAHRARRLSAYAKPKAAPKPMMEPAHAGEASEPVEPGADDTGFMSELERFTSDSEPKRKKG